MRHYIAVIHKDSDSSYGVHFPDVPGCFSAGDTLDEAIRNAGEALRFFAENSEPMPVPRSLEEIRADPQVGQDIGLGCTFAAIPFFLDAHRTVRANLTMDAALLEAIDVTAKARGQTRSGFLASIARKEIFE
ncbi:CopG family transcriptional regulator [Stappia sp. GBMRC 2046]|uniref:CopG family transcriptional regulator n=1 Tax=Stappia sediminis TaxID=2692190 RepID=A0A7X3LX83_9HYPH|nr:type II toxin-antitoxin system HicB family antitoxin [Stappia sediminis]MXN66844.1 CopG family transcriptional regulator [Stappia sediminis]